MSKKKLVEYTKEEQRAYLKELAQRVEEGRKVKQFHYDIDIEKVLKLSLEEIAEFCKENKLRYRYQDGVIVFVDFRMG